MVRVIWWGPYYLRSVLGRIFKALLPRWTQCVGSAVLEEWEKQGDRKDESYRLGTLSEEPRRITAGVIPERVRSLKWEELSLSSLTKRIDQL